MTQKRIIFAILSFFLFRSAELNAFETTRTLKSQFLGGQYFFEGHESSLAGNVSVVYSQLWKINERSNVLALYDGSYRGTKEVTDLVGGGTLFQEASDHRLGSRFIYQLNDLWLAKGVAGFKYELLRETRDEKWFKGLFDYRKLDVGFELERVWNKNHLTFAYSFYPIWFPNYETLESKTNLGRELAGVKTLDTFNHSIHTGWEGPWLGSGHVAGLSLSGFERFFPQQHLVARDGNFMSKKRQDSFWTARVEEKYARLLTSGLGLAAIGGLNYSLNLSNQNHFDANESRFFEDYYGYSELALSVGLRLMRGLNAGQAQSVSLSVWSSFREYAKRLAQNSDGVFMDKETYLKSLGFALAYSMPLGEQGLYLKTSIHGAWQISNMQHEVNYQYNFSTFNYLLGFTYEY